jgi:hypothetical protein
MATSACFCRDVNCSLTGSADAEVRPALTFFNDGPRAASAWLAREAVGVGPIWVELAAGCDAPGRRAALDSLADESGIASSDLGRLAISRLLEDGP